MAYSAPKTKDWKAWQDLQPVGQPKLIVTGQVEVGNMSDTPHLKEAVPQGIVASTLLLDLTITSGGTGGAVMNWKEARFEKPIKKDQYKQVEIRFGSEIVGKAEVKTVQ